MTYMDERERVHTHIPGLFKDDLLFPMLKLGVWSET